MRLTCPCCGASYGLEVLLADRSAREAVAAALALPSALGERLLRYIGLFRPAQRALSWDRAARLLTELQAAINAASIERDGRVYSAPVEYWRIAIDQMLDNRERLSLPLKSHGYLHEIIVGIGKRAEERGAARQEVADERAKAREGERGGRMRSAGTMVGEGADIVGTGDRPNEGADIVGTGDRPNEGADVRGRGDRPSEGADVRGRGDRPVAPTPARVPPPPEFRALLARLTGKTAPENADGQAD